MVNRIISKIIQNTPLRWHVANRVTRMEAIQRAIDTLQARRYLEIGVDDGMCFSQIKVTHKIGIDPVAAKPLVVAEQGKPGVLYFALTSDAFFAQESSGALTAGVDVVFVDGLHTYAQTYQDCVNSLKHLNRGGVMLLHDCLPKTEMEATPAANHQDAWRINGPTWDGYWTGDSWKAITALRAFHPDVSACVLDTDQGLGIVFKQPTDVKLDLTREKLETMTFSDLVADKERLLDVRKPVYLLDCLATLRRQRA